MLTQTVDDVKFDFIEKVFKKDQETKLPKYSSDHKGVSSRRKGDLHTVHSNPIELLLDPDRLFIKLEKC